LIVAWRSGDARAAPIMEQALAAMDSLCRLLVTLLDPELLVIAGGVGQATPELVTAARAALDPHPLAPEAGAVRVEPAQLGPDAGLLGAALLARTSAAQGPP
jgi:glucokinase